MKRKAKPMKKSKPKKRAKLIDGELFELFNYD